MDIPDFHYGLDDRATTPGIAVSGGSGFAPLGSLSQCANMHLLSDGSVEKRGGTQRIHASTVPGPTILGGHIWRPTPSTVDLFIITDDANAFYNTSSLTIPVTFTLRGGGFSTTNYPSFADFRDASADVVYIADGGFIRKWSGSVLSSAIGGTPSAIGQIAVYNQRLFGISGTDQTLYWSALNNGDTLGNAGAGGGSAIIRTFSNDPIVALAPLGDTLLMFHTRAISRFTGWSQDDFSVDEGTRGVDNNVGCGAARSVVSIGKSVFFLGAQRSGVHITDGVSVTRVTDTVSARFENLSLSGAEFSLHIPAMRSVILFNTIGGHLVYNYHLNAWSGPYSFVWPSDGPLSGWVDPRADLLTSGIYLGGQQGWVRQLYTDGVTATQSKDDVTSAGSGGTAVTGSLTTNALPLGGRFDEVRAKWAFVNVAANNTHTPEVAIGNGSYTTLDTSGAGGGIPSYFDYRVPFISASTTVQLVFRDSSAVVPPVRISSGSVEGFLMGRRAAQGAKAY